MAAFVQAARLFLEPKDAMDIEVLWVTSLVCKGGHKEKVKSLNPRQANELHASLIGGLVSYKARGLIWV